AFLAQPNGHDSFREALNDLATFVERPVRGLLIVDDDESERLALSDLLGGEDVHVEAVGTGEDALQILEKGHVNCLVLDLRLPDGSGFDLLERLKTDERFRDVPVIVHTGKA